MRHEFRVVYTPIEDGWFLAQAPELPGAVTQGQTLDEARAMIKEAIELLLETYRENAERDAPGNAVWETLAVETPAL
ncbi:MAG: type II toxin-antitoxin system HicB family antitoxin [Candidatus Hydrogenedentes bacterium]|nr:type II toxin-antitoxin system HicB family antitoxin [Candidatus Hydrogenedentota bacterium]